MTVELLWSEAKRGRGFFFGDECGDEDDEEDDAEVRAVVLEDRLGWDWEEFGALCALRSTGRGGVPCGRSSGVCSGDDSASEGRESAVFERLWATATALTERKFVLGVEMSVAAFVFGFAPAPAAVAATAGSVSSTDSCGFLLLLGGVVSPATEASSFTLVGALASASAGASAAYWFDTSGFAAPFTKRCTKSRV